MKKILKYLALSAFVATLASCGSNNSKADDKKEDAKDSTDYTLDDANYQVTEEEFRNMYNVTGDYSVSYILYSNSSGVVVETLDFKKDNNKMILQHEYPTFPSSNYIYYSITNVDSTTSTVKYENSAYSKILFSDISTIIPKSTSYISMDNIIDNKTFDSKSNMYKVNDYPYTADFNLDMCFKFEEKTLVYYEMKTKYKNLSSSIVKVNFSYDDQTITIPEEALQLLNN